MYIWRGTSELVHNSHFRVSNLNLYKQKDKKTNKMWNIEIDSDHIFFCFWVWSSLLYQFLPIELCVCVRLYIYFFILLFHFAFCFCIITVPNSISKVKFICLSPIRSCFSFFDDSIDFVKEEWELAKVCEAHFSFIFMTPDWGWLILAYCKQWVPQFYKFWICFFGMTLNQWNGTFSRQWWKQWSNVWVIEWLNCCGVELFDFSS